MSILNLPDSMSADKYYLGRLCVRSHVWETTGKSLRRVSDRHCVRCEKERQSSEDYRQQENEWKRQKRLAAQSLRPPKIKLTEEERKQRAKEASKRWLERNQDKAREATRNWYKNNRDHACDYVRQWRKDNQEHQKRYAKNYSATNPEVIRLISHRYRARKAKNRVEPYTPEQLLKRYSEVFGNECAYCGCSDSKLTDDHFIPLYLGGCDALFNMVPACGSCNFSKWANPPEYWYKKQIFFAVERWTRLVESTDYPLELERLGQQILSSPPPRRP